MHSLRSSRFCGQSTILQTQDVARMLNLLRTLMKGGLDSRARKAGRCASAMNVQRESMQLKDNESFQMIH